MNTPKRKGENHGYCFTLGFLLSGLIACAPSAHTPGDKAYAASVQPGTVEADSDFEREVLRALGEMKTGSASTISGQEVIAGRIYYAASGRRCREVQIKNLSEPRLACEMHASWHFVPSLPVPSLQKQSKAQAPNSGQAK